MMPSPLSILNGQAATAFQGAYGNAGPWGTTIPTALDNAKPVGNDTLSQLSQGVGQMLPQQVTGSPPAANSVLPPLPPPPANLLAPPQTPVQPGQRPSPLGAMGMGMSPQMGQFQGLLAQQAGQLPGLQQQQSTNRTQMMQALNNIINQQQNFMPPSLARARLAAEGAAMTSSPNLAVGLSNMNQADANAMMQQAEIERERNNNIQNLQLQAASLPEKFGEEDIKNSMDALKEGVAEERIQAMMNGMFKNPMAIAMQMAKNAGLDTPEGKMWSAYANKLAGSQINLDGSQATSNFGFPDPTVSNSPGTLKNLQKEDSAVAQNYKTAQRFADAAKQDLATLLPNLDKTITGPYSGLVEGPLGAVHTILPGVAPENVDAYQTIQKSTDSLVNNLSALQHVPGMRGSVLQLQTLLNSKPGVQYAPEVNRSIASNYQGVLSDFDNTLALHEAYREASPAHIIDPNVDKIDDALKTIYPATKMNGQFATYDDKNAQALQQSIDDAIANPHKYISLAQQIKSGKLKPASNGVISALSAPQTTDMPQVGSAKQPSAASITHLKQNPQLASQFDEAYGAGASQRILGGQ